MFRHRFVPIAAAFGLGLGCAAGSSTGYGSNNNSPPPTPTTGDVAIVEGARLLGSAAFNPNPETVALSGGAGVQVRWVNGDITGGDYQTGVATAHSIVSDNMQFASSGSLGGNATYPITLTAAGDYSYHCGIHPTMVGTIHVDP